MEGRKRARIEGTTGNIVTCVGTSYFFILVMIPSVVNSFKQLCQLN